MKRLLLLLIMAVVCLSARASVTVTVNGSNHTIPQTNEKGWGSNVTAWIQAISANTLQPSGGTFTLTAEVNTGATYGFKVPYIKGPTVNPSSVGVLRLAESDSIGWRNNANGADLLLAVDNSDRLTFNGVVLPTATAASVQDSTFSIYDNSDATKLIAFQASAITAGNTRTLTMADANVDLADVANATDANTASRIVKRDGGGNFAAGTITATLTGNVTGALTGNASTATALAANPADCAADTYATTIAANGALTCASITNASTTATSTNTNSAIVARDSSGNFAAGTITAALTGNASTATALASNPSDCGADTYATTIAASGNLTCATVTNAGLAGSIAFNKHVALTASRALVSDGSGVVSVSSVPTTNLVKTTAANITYSAGTPTVTNEYGGDWISTISDGGTGLPTLNVSGFTTAPVCTCTAKESAVSGAACTITSTSTSTIPVRTRDMAGSLVDEHFFIVCTEFF